MTHGDLSICRAQLDGERSRSAPAKARTAQNKKRNHEEMACVEGSIGEGRPHVRGEGQLIAIWREESGWVRMICDGTQKAAI